MSSKMEQIIDEALTTLGVSGQHILLEDGRWFVAIREEIGYLVSANDDYSKVNVDFPIGPLPREVDSDRLKSLLKFNALGQIFADARLYITSADALVLSTSLSQGSADGQSLAFAFVSLDKAREVVEAILGGGSEGVDDLPGLAVRSQWVPA